MSYFGGQSKLKGYLADTCRGLQTYAPNISDHFDGGLVMIQACAETGSKEHHRLQQKQYLKVILTLNIHLTYVVKVPELKCAHLSQYN
jgi:hypothetical protein